MLCNVVCVSILLKKREGKLHIPPLWYTHKTWNSHVVFFVTYLSCVLLHEALPHLWFIYEPFSITTMEFDVVTSINITYKERIEENFCSNLTVLWKFCSNLTVLCLYIFKKGISFKEEKSFFFSPCMFLVFVTSLIFMKINKNAL